MKNYIHRYIENLDKVLKPGKAVVILGPRRTGKTTLVNHYLHDTKVKYRFETGDNLRIVELFESGDFDQIKEFTSGFDLVVIDEAQKIKNIGHGLKILTDYLENLRLLITGSSSFELLGQIGEPLTGRKITLTLFTIAQLELLTQKNRYDLRENLEQYLIFGSYPEVIISENNTEKINVLNEILGSYLLKDILELDRVKSSKLLLDLLRLLAFQVGNQVSLSELANNLHIDYKTVARYIDLFEKSFVLFSLGGYSGNLRSEVTRKCKYYFYDNGIRNALIANFNPLSMRNDVGALWENFLFMERLKMRSYKNQNANIFFWRTYDQKEIDLIEEWGGGLFGYEFKWGNKRVKPPRQWLSEYPGSGFEVINPENYFNFIL
ncbi:MAG: ATP-binding protein [Bacteroidota bacterium]